MGTEVGPRRVRRFHLPHRQNLFNQVAVIGNVVLGGRGGSSLGALVISFRKQGEIASTGNVRCLAASSAMGTVASQLLLISYVDGSALSSLVAPPVLFSLSILSDPPFLLFPGVFRCHAHQIAPDRVHDESLLHIWMGNPFQPILVPCLFPSFWMPGRSMQRFIVQSLKVAEETLACVDRNLPVQSSRNRDWGLENHLHFPLRPIHIMRSLPLLEVTLPVCCVLHEEELQYDQEAIV